MTTLNVPYGPLVDAEVLASGVGKYKADRIDAAAERLEAERKRLRQPDGAPLYVPEELAKRETALLARFDQDTRLIADEADKDLAAAERTLARLEGADPLDRLDSDQLQRAGALKAFIDEDVATLPAADLEARIAAVVASGDRVRAVLYVRALRGRVNALRARMLDQGGHLARREGEDLRRFGHLLDRLEALVADPHAAEKRAEAEADIRRSRALQNHLRRTRGQYDGSAAAYERDIRARFGL